MKIFLNTGGITGLVGTLGYRIQDMQNATVQARTTDGIVEDPAGAGIYEAVVADVLLAGHEVIWDTGGATPLYGNEAFPVNLNAYQSGATLAMSVNMLAMKAYTLYPRRSPALYLPLVAEGLKAFIAQTGMVFTQEQDYDLSAGPIVALPADYRNRSRKRFIYLDDAGVAAELELVMRDELADVLAGKETGTPTQYGYPDGTHLIVYPTPASGTLRIEYDGNLPLTYDFATELPVPREYEMALMAYAIARVATLVVPPEVPDFGVYNIWNAVFLSGVSQWRHSLHQRTEDAPVIAPYYGSTEEE